MQLRLVTVSLYEYETDTKAGGILSLPNYGVISHTIYFLSKRPIRGTSQILPTIARK